MDKNLEIEELKKEINFYNYQYHVLDQSLISDYEYDKMLKRLRVLENKYPDLVTSDSPTLRAGGPPLDRFIKIKHPAPILSLANAFSKEDLMAWYERNLRIQPQVAQSGYVLEPKIDGLTIVLRYEEGVLVQGATRGDGLEGEDITSNIRTIKSVPLKIPVEPGAGRAPQVLVIRAEAFITKSNFEKLNQILKKRGEKTYQNPRNTAAGALRQLDPALTRTRPLTILAYAIVKSTGPVSGTQWEVLTFLKKMGFPVSDLVEQVKSMEGVLEKCEGWINRRDEIPYEVDGVVIKLNDLKMAEVLGVAGKDPRGAIALKYPAREVSTILKDIGVNVGRTGILTPYAVLDPVEVGGVTIKLATLHNFDFINEKDILIGDRVLVKRAGDVIPYIIGPIVEVRSGKEKKFEMPKNCPSCGQFVERVFGEVGLYCSNLACPAQLVRNLENFVSRGAMDVEGLGGKIVEQLSELGLVKDIADLYQLNRGDLLGIEGFAERKTDQLLKAIQISKKKPLSRLIVGLGIRGVGESAAKALEENFMDLDELSQASVLSLQGIEGIGPNIANTIVEWVSRQNNQELIKKLKYLGVVPEKTTRNNSDQPFEGKTFVITGTLPILSRDDAKKFIESYGGKVHESISTKTNFIVIGENPGSKKEKAITLGIQQLDEQGLKDLAREESEKNSD
ncbi:MAG: NAD-dependent DNA ligase LigA [Chloroflexi bacterium]|nr:NAD-dependent DNA ligase LigA [Chloroflexota bacterium]